MKPSISSGQRAVMAAFVAYNKAGLKDLKLKANAGGACLSGSGRFGQRKLLIVGAAGNPSIMDDNVNARKANVVVVTEKGRAFFSSWAAQWAEEQGRQGVLYSVDSHRSGQLSLLGIAVDQDTHFAAVLPQINRCLREGLIKVVSLGGGAT